MTASHMIQLSRYQREEALRLLHQALGDEILSLQRDRSDLEDIAINQNGAAFAYTGQGRFRLKTRFDEDRARQVVQLAARFGGVVAEDYGMTTFSAVLPGNIRFQGGLPPRSINGPYVVMRFLSNIVRDFDDYVKDGVAPYVGKPDEWTGDEGGMRAGYGMATMDCIAAGLEAGAVFSVFGETGSGKSSLITSMLNHPHMRARRLGVVEDEPELQFPNVEDVLRLSSVGSSLDSVMKDMLRCRPDVIVLGEARDGSFWSFILAQYTGHKGGIVSLHADNPKDFFDRCEQMISMAGQNPELQRRVMMKTMQRIIWIRRGKNNGRDIVGVFVPDGYDPATGYRLKRIDVPHPGRSGI